MGIMKALIIRDKSKRFQIQFLEEKRKCLKSLKHNQFIKLTWWSRFKLSSLPSKNVKTRCIITGRAKAVNRNFKLSRLEFRRWASRNIIPGLKKSSW